MSRALTAKTFAANVAIVGLGLITSVVLSRLLGPSGRGELGAAMLWPVLLVAVSSVGFIPASLYFSGQNGGNPDVVLANATIVGVVQGAVAMAVGYIALPFLLPRQPAAVIAASRMYLCVIPVSLITQYGISVIQGRLQMSLFNLLRLIIPCGYLAGVVVLGAIGHLTLLNVLLLNLCLNIVAFLAVVLALRFIGVSISLRGDRDLGKQMLSYGLKVHAGDLSQLGNLRLDQTLIAGWLPPAQLGLYLAGVSAASSIQILSTAVRQVVMPTIISAPSPAVRVERLQKAFSAYCIVSLPVTLVVALILPWGIPLVFGAAFAAAVVPAQLLLAGMFCLSAKDVLAGGAQALGNPWLSSRAEIMALLIIIALLVLLLPRLGITGAAVAAMFGYAGALGFLLRGLHNAYGLSPRKLLTVDAALVRTILARRVSP